MNKATLLIVCGVGRMAVAGLFLWKASGAFSGYGIVVPRWMPPRLPIGLLVVLVFGLVFGWIVPMAIGIRLAIKGR